MCFLTITWAADLAHFSMLRESLQRSALSHIPHHIVVQDEDLHLFRKFEQPGVHLYSSADILPAEVESRRKSALHWQRVFGRRGAKVGGSIVRYAPFPQWVRFTGWHTQQMSKLAFVLNSAVDTVVILDSDVIVTPHANEQDFAHPTKVVCYQHWREPDHLKGKVRNWQKTASSLFRHTFDGRKKYDAYYDTPFVMHAPTVRLLRQWLEKEYALPWWQVLVNLPPRRWSEFGIYKHYLRYSAPCDVEWRDSDIFGYLFDISNEQTLFLELDRLLNERESHFITIHSQNSGRKLWNIDVYQHKILERLFRAGAEAHG